MTTDSVLVLRPTGIKTFLVCPRLYFATYVEDAPRMVSAALAIGSAFHKAAEVLVGALKARRSPTEVLAEAEATLEETLALERTLGDPDPDDDKFETAKDTAIGLVRAAAESLPPTWEPAEVEATAGVPITDDVTVQGTTDLVLKDGTIVDFKTRARKSSESDVRRDLQFTAYSTIRNHVDGIPNATRRMKIVEVTKTKIPQVHIQPTERDRQDYDTYRDIVTKVATAIRASLDHPAPGFLCNSCSVRKSACPLYRKTA